jgi:hypothetical protein
MTLNQFCQANPGEVVISQIKDSKDPNYCRVQFKVAVSRTEIPQEFFNSDTRGTASSNPLVAMSQASNPGQYFMSTAHMSVHKEKIDAAGLPRSVDYAEQDDNFVKAEVLYPGVTVVINTYRCTEKNPFSETQDPVMNPSTHEAMTLNDKLIYQHSEVTVGTANTFTFGTGLPNWITANLPKQATKVTAEVDAVLDAMSA